MGMENYQYGILVPAINYYEKRPDTEEEEFTLGVLPPGYFYQFSQDKWGLDFKFTLTTRVNVCHQKTCEVFLSDFNESNVVGVEFPQ